LVFIYSNCIVEDFIREITENSEFPREFIEKSLTEDDRNYSTTWYYLLEAAKDYEREQGVQVN
jgi:hypothetical protein